MGVKLPKFPVSAIRFRTSKRRNGPRLLIEVDYWSFAYVKFSALVAFTATREFRSLTIGAQTLWALIRPMLGRV